MTLHDPFYDRACPAGHFCCFDPAVHEHSLTPYDCRGCWNLNEEDEEEAVDA